jgi:hypothetical protein
MTNNPFGRLGPGALLCALLSNSAVAGCGADFCAVNTRWDSQGIWTQPGWRADLRFEYLDQDQLRSGAHTVAPGQIPREHDEVRTLNRNWFATLDYGSAQGWGASLIVPMVGRDHTHIDNDAGGVLEQWSFRELGDVRALGRYQVAAHVDEEGRSRVLGLNFGLKLPTGRYDVRNADGELAERMFQPGSGTTDALLGGYLNGAIGPRHSWFTQVLVQLPLNSREGYQPGERAGLDLGYRFAASRWLGLHAQLNFLWRNRDHGINAEPEDSGGTFVFVSPGVSVALTPKVQLFAFAQLPLYQYVNGVQLTSSWAASAGVSVRF